MATNLFLLDGPSGLTLRDIDLRDTLTGDTESEGDRGIAVSLLSRRGVCVAVYMRVKVYRSSRNR